MISEDVYFLNQIKGFHLVRNRLLKDSPYGPPLQTAYTESSYIMLSFQIMSNCCLKSARTISRYEKEFPHLRVVSLSFVPLWHH